MRRLLLTSLLLPLQIMIVAGLLAFQTGSSVAQTPPLTAQQVSQFKTDPSSALAANPSGGGRLVSFIRDLLLSDKTTLQSIVALLTTANADQQSAIGSGLGQAAQALASTDPSFASEIQRLLAESGSNLAIASYQSTTGNVQTGAAGGAGGGGGGAGPTNGGPPAGGGGGGGIGGAAGGTGSGGTGSTGILGVSGSTPSSSSSLATNVSPQ
jgi:hypothetical protein